MSELLRWLAKLAKSAQGRPELFDALLTGSYRRYAYHRLRFMAPRITLRLLTQFFEVFVLSTVLPWEYFVPLLSYRASSALIGGTYWGALEELRTRVREEVRKRHYESARRFVEAWLGVSVLLALACCVGIALWTRYSEDPTGEVGFSLFDAYAVACFFRLALDIVVRTYHAGIFAMTRVYRPLATILLPDILELVFVIVAWNRLGPWGIALSIMLAGILRSVWTYIYARRAYTHSRIARPRLWGAFRARHVIRLGGLARSAMHALANGSAQVDSLLILTLAHATPSEGQEMPLAVVYYVLRPLMTAAHGWTRVFYFDWKRMETGVGRVFQPRMRAMLINVGLAIVAVFGVLLSLIGYGLWGERGLWSLAALLPLFVARTMYSLEQLEAFSLGHYARLARLAALVLAAVVLIGQSRLAERELLLASAVVLLCAVLWSMRARHGQRRQESTGQWLGAWLTRLTDTKEPVAVFAMCADRKLVSAPRLARAAARCFPIHQVARAGRSHVIAFATCAEAPQRSTLIAGLGGAVRELLHFESSSGAVAALKLVENGWLKRVLALDLSVPASTRAELLQEFRARIPDGHVLELDIAHGRVASSPLPWAARRMILREIASRAAGARPRHDARSPFRIAVLSSRAIPAVVFIAPGNAPDFAAFLKRVEHTSLRSALSASPVAG